MNCKILSIISASFLVWPFPAFAAQGVAVIKGTAQGSPISGTVSFIDSKDGLKIEAKLANVPNAGKHGFHIHENGSCADDGKAAGGHYNPMTVDHGFLPKDGEAHAHMGDMGNIEITADGTGTLSITLPGVSLKGGDHNVDGRAVILHEKADDFGQPTGNAGGRIGCGIITVAEQIAQPNDQPKPAAAESGAKTSAQTK